MKKGFTLVELLVVIAIIAVLLGVLMPSLAKVRNIADRMVCSTHLSDVGKSMMMYAQEHNGKYPTAGTPASVWSKTGSIAKWDGKDSKEAYGAKNEVTVTASLYLLVRYQNMDAKMFICEGDKDVTRFNPADYITTTSTSGTGTGTTATPTKSMTEYWDFGPNPGQHCSYAYQMPYSSFAIDGTSTPSSPVMGDRNPYLDKNALDYTTDTRIADPCYASGEYKDPGLKGNAAQHERKGQNVLFMDGHVATQATPNCGYNNDNIYRAWNSKNNPTEEEKQVKGLMPKQGDLKLYNKDDTCLVSERNDNPDPQ
jgi:prepilin-type N-terminal cleavage/methylation domain-containing protein/prepilin-type processing-associated H-X9-DG protein